MRPNLQSANEGLCFPVPGHKEVLSMGRLVTHIKELWGRSKRQRVCLQRNRPLPPSLLLTFGLATGTGGTYVTTGEGLCAAGPGLPLGTYLPPYLPAPESTPVHHPIERAGSKCVTSALHVWNDYQHFRTGTFRHGASCSGLPA